MKSIFTAIIIMAMASFNLFAAKNQSQIRGQVRDKADQNPIEFATVSIHKQDSTILGGATTDVNGNFTISNIPFGNYILKVSFIGYKTYIMDLDLNEQNSSIGVIEIESDSQMLEAGKITAKVPVIEQKLDKLVMNVSEAVSTQGSNALELLRKAPGVSVDKDGNVLLNGSNVSVWIDGRPSYMSGKELEALLLSTDANTIDKIEIIAHPSAKYDAAGRGGIINIKTKKNFAKGLNGTLSGSYGAMYFDRYLQDASGTINLGYRSDKSNTVLTYTPRMSQDGILLDSETKFNNGGDMLQKSATNYMFEQSSHSVKLANDFFLNKKNIFGVIVSTLLKNDNNYSYGDSFTDTYLNGNHLIRQKSDINNKNSFDNIMGNINYTRIFNEQKAQEITFNADYAYYDLFDGSSQENRYINPVTGVTLPNPNLFTSDGKQYINLYSFKADYQQLFWGTGMLEAGVKWAMTSTANSTLRQDFINNVWVKNDALSSVFDYNEQIAAAYITASKMFSPKWVAKVGLRAEHTRSSGKWISLGQDIDRDPYTNLFPTLYVGYNPSQNWRYSMTYTRRIERPSYSQLNPQRLYIDATSSLQGNPNITPAFSNQFALSVGFKSFLNLALIYSSQNNLIMQNPIIDATTGEKNISWGNFGKLQLAGANLSITELPIFKWMILNTNIFGSYVVNSNTAGNYKTEGSMINNYTTLTFLAPKDWKFEIGEYYMSGLPIGYFKIHSQISFFAGVKKELFNNKATLSINVNDLFRTQKNTISMFGDNNFVYNFNQVMNDQKVKVSFTYRFGTVKQSKVRNVGNMDEASRVGGGGSIGANTTTK